MLSKKCNRLLQLYETIEQINEAIHNSNTQLLLSLRYLYTYSDYSKCNKDIGHNIFENVEEHYNTQLVSITLCHYLEISFTASGLTHIREA
jgi:hypothetical protein